MSFINNYTAFGLECHRSAQFKPVEESQPYGLSFVHAV
jgi:hypothetical protein